MSLSRDAGCAIACYSCLLTMFCFFGFLISKFSKFRQILNPHPYTISSHCQPANCGNWMQIAYFSTCFLVYLNTKQTHYGWQTKYQTKNDDQVWNFFTQHHRLLCNLLALKKASSMSVQSVEGRLKPSSSSRVLGFVQTQPFGGSDTLLCAGRKSYGPFVSPGLH